MWGLFFAAALAANPILERAHEAHAELRYEDALGLVELVLGQSNLSQTDRGEALELRATLRASIGCTAEAIRAFQDLLAWNKHFKPQPGASPKIRECYELTLSTMPAEPPETKPKPPETKPKVEPAQEPIPPTKPATADHNASDVNATATATMKTVPAVEIRREVVSVPPSGLVWGTFAVSVVTVVASANFMALGWIESASLREDIRAFNENGGSDEDRAALRDRRQNLRTLDGLAIGAGAVGITAGALWAYFNFGNTETTVDVSAAAGGGQVWLRQGF